MLNNKKTNLSAANTVIGEEVTLESALFKGSGTVRIDGHYIGAIDINGNIVIGEKGVVKGNIKARQLLVAGTVEGDVVCENEIHFAPSAKVLGNVTSLIIVIDEGATFNGNCNMAKKSGELEVLDLKKIAATS